jgi:hypothetical protein
MKVSIGGILIEGGILIDTDEIQLIGKIKKNNSGMWFDIHFRNGFTQSIYYPNEENLDETLNIMRNDLASKWGMIYDTEHVIFKNNE